MNRQARLKVVLAVLGFAMAASLFAYLEFTDYARLPHTGEAVIAWSVIAATNAVLYATVGSIVARYFRKPTDSLQAKPQQ